MGDGGIVERGCDPATVVQCRREMGGEIMSTLTAFLKEEGRRLRAEAPMRESKKQDWIRAVSDLLTQLQSWVKEADTEGLIELETKQWPFPFREEGLGEYHLPYLRLRLDTRSIAIKGKARNVVDRIRPPGVAQSRQADGVVVIGDSPLKGQTGTTDYYLYRLTEPDGDHWYIRHPLEEEVKPLDRERFEAVLVSLLK
jgi:hypothetical protein